MTNGTTAKTSPLRIFGQPKMATLVVLGFSSGLPFYLTSKTLQAWMTTAKVDLATIGFFSLVTLPYSLKFVWAPLMDRYTPPFLGRRRGWVLITQIALLLVIAAMSLHDPRTGLKMLAINAIAIAFFSASQDISLDAYRTDVLENREMGAGAAVFVLGYRVAMITTGALAFFLADRIAWRRFSLPSQFSTTRRRARCSRRSFSRSLTSSNARESYARCWYSSSSSPTSTPTAWRAA